VEKEIRPKSPPIKDIRPKSPAITIIEDTPAPEEIAPRISNEELIILEV
jgi:hypothetical protein